jgi:glutaredoxin 2
VPFAELEFQDIEVDFIQDLFEGCDPEDERVASDKFQEYIESAAQRQFAQLKNDESELQEDLKKTETLASSVEQSLRELDERIQKVENSKKKY